MLFYKKLKRMIFNRLIPLIKIKKYIEWILYCFSEKKVMLIIGAGKSKYKSWFPTDIHTLDITKEKDFRKYFLKRKINKVLAEHVLEHLNNSDLKIMLQNIYNYSDFNLTFRVAVPDGYHPDKNYIELVKPGGEGIGAADHKHLFNYIDLSELFKKAGFLPHLVEYWDEKGLFHSDYSDENGYIHRSLKNDERNRDGKPNYTSLIIDFTKNQFK